VLGRSTTDEKKKIFTIFQWKKEEKRHDRAGKDACFYMFSIRNLVTVESVITHAEETHL